jgi:hypothetical protein
MYLSGTTHTLQIELLASAVTDPEYVVSYQDVTSAGMTLPMASSQGTTNDTTAVTMVAAPGASTTRQVTHISLFNHNSSSVTARIWKDVGGMEYNLCRVLLQVGDTLEWTRETGWHVLTNSQQESVIITEFTANGTWTKPAGLKRALVCCVGAGGGGGSGRCDAAGTNRFGGGGGGGGAIVWRQIAAADLTGTVAVTTGTAGTGGTGVSTVATSGNAGTAGGDTSFGALVIAKGGGGGGGGTNAAGANGSGGVALSCSPIGGPYAINGGGGGSGQSANGSSGATGLSGSIGASAGGSGGGINSSNASSTAGGTGGGIYQNGIAITGPSSGASPNGAANQSRFLLFSSTLSSTAGLGTGGAGGYHTNYPLFIAGGNAGSYGAGGGGGSASVTGNISGAGGNGAGGLCLVMEVY